MHFTPPDSFSLLWNDTEAAGFSMASDPQTGSLLRTLAAAKPGGRFLELGTGTGLSTSWLLDGMDAGARLTTIDNDPELLAIARRHLGKDDRLEIVEADGGVWLTENNHERYDLIFADTWHGKYLMLDEALSLLNSGGLYIVDDMLPQPNWPEGHEEKARRLTAELGSRSDVFQTGLDWSTGIILCVKR